MIPTHWKARKADENEDFHGFVELLLLCLRFWFWFLSCHTGLAETVTMLVMVGGSFLQEGVETTKGTIIWVVLGPPENCRTWGLME